MEDEMEKIEEVHRDAQARFAGHRLFLRVLADALIENGALDWSGFIGNLDQLVRSGRQTNQASEAIEEVRLLRDALAPRRS
jgi:hypothetical protein